MKVLVVANEDQQNEIITKATNAEIKFEFITKFTGFAIDNTYDALFYLSEEDINISMVSFSKIPVIINSVIKTLSQKKLPENFSRINGWPGFLQRETWEVVSNNYLADKKLFEALGWEIIFVKDEPGFVAARVISMIINEAFFALEDNVSTIEEIDLAMKLGTNYPFGPFEWLSKIGIKHIYDLLKSLTVLDKRYYVSSLLEKKYLQHSAL